MDQYLQHYGKLIRYSLTGWPEFRKRLESEPHHRWGGEGADHTLRGAAADAYQEREDLPSEEAEHGAALLRNPNEHVVIDGDGKVKRGQWNTKHIDYTHQLIRNRLLHHYSGDGVFDDIYFNPTRVERLGEHHATVGDDTVHLGQLGRHLADHIVDRMYQFLPHAHAVVNSDPTLQTLLHNLSQENAEEPHHNQEV